MRQSIGAIVATLKRLECAFSYRSNCPLAWCGNGQIDHHRSISSGVSLRSAFISASRPVSAGLVPIQECKNAKMQIFVMVCSYRYNRQIAQRAHAGCEIDALILDDDSRPGHANHARCEMATAMDRLFQFEFRWINRQLLGNLDGHLFLGSIKITVRRCDRNNHANQ